MNKMTAFLRETLELLYFAYFKPSALQEQLNQAAPQGESDTSFRQITPAVFDMRGARRFLLQCLLWWLLGLLPFEVLAWGNISPWGLALVSVSLLMGAWGVAGLYLPAGLAFTLMGGLAWWLKPELWPAVQEVLAHRLNLGVIGLLLTSTALAAVMGGGGAGLAAARGHRRLVAWATGIAIFMAGSVMFVATGGAALTGATATVMALSVASALKDKTDVLIVASVVAGAVVGGVAIILAIDMAVGMAIIMTGSVAMAGVVVASGLTGAVEIVCVALPVAFGVKVVKGVVRDVVTSVVALSVALGAVLGLALGVALGVTCVAVVWGSLPLLPALGLTVALGFTLSALRPLPAGLVGAVIIAALFIVPQGWAAAGAALIAFLAGYLRLPIYPLILLAILFAVKHVPLLGGRPLCLLPLADEIVWLPLFGLDRLLVDLAEKNPEQGHEAIARVVSSFRQDWAAQAAQIELDARRLERCADVEAISHAHPSLASGELSGPASALLRSFSRLSQDTDAALHQESAYNRRLVLSAVEDHLDGLLRELTRSSERYAVRFRPIATQWRQIVAEHVRELAEAVELRQEIDSPYVVGAPLTVQQEIFVGRTDVSARIEGLLLDRRRPPLLLYGQRRMGKTSLLNNLGRLLHSTIIPLFVDLQGPPSQAPDHAGFLYNIARGMNNSAERQRNLALPPLPREALEADPFTRFDEWLDEVEQVLGQNTALLALDEFEALDSAITKGRFDEEAVLGTLRHLIQHRPRFKVLLAGSHTLDELQRWASYLINVQVVHISYLRLVHN